MSNRKSPETRGSDDSSAKANILLRVALAYLALGAFLAEATFLAVRSLGLSPALLEAVLALLFLGLPTVLIGISMLEERFGTQALAHAIRRTPWTSAPVALLLGAVVLAAGVGGWGMVPGMLGTGSIYQSAGTGSTVTFLPMRMLSQHPGDQGVAEELSHQVRGQIRDAFPSLTVVMGEEAESSTASATFIIQETFRRSGDEAVLSIEILDAQTGQRVWSGSMGSGAERARLDVRSEEFRSELSEMAEFLERRLGIDSSVN